MILFTPRVPSMMEKNNMLHGKNSRGIRVAAVIALLAVGLFPDQSYAQDEGPGNNGTDDGVALEALDLGLTEPDPPSVADTLQPFRSQAEKERMALELESIKEEHAEGTRIPEDPNPQPDLDAAAEVAAITSDQITDDVTIQAPTQTNPQDVVTSQAPMQFSPQDLITTQAAQDQFLFGRNNKNTIANGSDASTLAEPAAANNGTRVLAAGNFDHVETSADGGNNWTQLTFSGGPADAPFVCCDHDILIDDARRTFFHSTLYINAAVNNGVVRIFVRDGSNAAFKCSYTIDGFANNNLPDYPHIGITQSHLYLSTNNVGSGSRARMWRFGLNEMDSCETTPTQAFDQPFAALGQRVWVPAEGTNNIRNMWWMQHNDSNTVRIFRWEDGAPGPVAVDRDIANSNFGNPDCRGGTGDFDYIGGVNASGIGFQSRLAAAPGADGGVEGEGALGTWWQAAPTGGATQGHIRAAMFSLDSLTLLNQPTVFNNNVCVGFPHVSASTRGDFGFVAAFGGRAGGGGTAARAWAEIDDEFTSGLGRFDVIHPFSAGTQNRSDGRYGDYFTIHPYEPCEKWFTATGYGRTSSSISGIDSRYVEFGRGATLGCYEANKFDHPGDMDPGAVVGFVLVDADADVDVGPLVDGGVVDLAGVPPNLSVRAEVGGGAVGSVVFDFDGAVGFRTENVVPYSLGGDTGGDYVAVALPVGSHTVTATPFSGLAGSGDAGVPLTINFEIVDTG